VNTPMKIEDFQEYRVSWDQDAQWLLQEAEKSGCLSPDDRNHSYISFMSGYPMGIIDEHEFHCGLKVLASFFRPTSHSPRSDSEDPVLQSTVILTPVFRFLVNNVVKVSVHGDEHF
jgi:hypothetical protein